MNVRSMLLAGVALALAACQSVPPTNVQQPMSARPVPRSENPYASGSIFNAASARPLFEDRRARFLGDTLTINITENTAASASANSSANRTGSISASVPTISGLPGKNFQGMALAAESGNNFAGKGATEAKNVFTGTITVTVIEVLDNGNLLVSGEKQVAVGPQQEYVRLSGVVNPSFINADNSIASSRIADARIEHKGSGYISEAQIMGWLARFFLTVMPF